MTERRVTVADLGHREAVVLLAVVDGARLYGEIMDATRLNRGEVKRALDALARQGLVQWQPGKQGTLRPKVTRSDLGARRS